MDAQHILIALQHTYNPEEGPRKEAEARLKQWEQVPGFMVALLQVVASNEVDPVIRKAGAIVFKGLTKKWRPRPANPAEPEVEPSIDFPEQDRVIVKENIVEALVHAPEAVQSQLAGAITKICNADFPEKWESFIPKVTHFVNSNNPQYMNGALVAFMNAIKKYSLLSGKKSKKAFNGIITSVFPLLEQVFSHLSSNDSIESAVIQRMIVKIFHLSIQFYLPAYMAGPNVLNTWMPLLCNLLSKQIPESVQPADLEERPKFAWWSAKKWAARILERFLRRYTKPRKADKKNVKKFSSMWAPTYAIKGMETLLHVMSGRRGPHPAYLPDKFTQSVLCYLRICIRFGVTYTALKPHLDVLVQEILFPYMCVSDADIALWKEEPLEYLRKEFDPIADYNNPRTESINFLADLVMLRGKAQLNNVMKFIVELLKKYLSLPENERNPREKDGCLHAIGALAPWLYSLPNYKANLESMLLVHVFPEFSSRFGFLRARSCWIFSQFRKVKFTNQDNFKGAVNKVLSMMHDPDLPVRVNAGISLRFILFAKNVEEILYPLLPHILEAVFKLMNEVESDDLVATLEGLIDKFGEKMAPYAVELVTRLSTQFMRFYKAADDAEEENDITASAASECLMALRSVLRGVRTMPHIYAAINPIMLPMFTNTLNDNSMDYFEHLLLLLTFCTFYGDVTPMWPTFELMCTAYDLWAADFLADMIPPLDNFISRAPEAFVNGPYLDMIMNIYRKAVGDASVDESIAGQATELAESVMHNCRGKVDRVMPEMISIAVNRLNAADSEDFKVLLIEVIANALFYNPLLTLQILESQGSTQAVFTRWFTLVPLLKRTFDIKLNILGLTAIYQMPINQLPAIIQHGTKNIFETLIKLLQKSAQLRKEYEDRKLDREHQLAIAKKEDEDRKATGQDMDSDSEDEIELQEIADHEDAEAIDSDADELDMALLENSDAILDDDALADQIAGDDFEIEGEGDDDDDDDEDDDDDDEDEDSDDDEEYITVIDKVDELVYFASRVHTMHNTDNTSFSALLGQLSQEDQKNLQELVESAKVREVENAKKEQERLQKAQQKK